MVLAFLGKVEDLAGGIDVALDEVAVEAVSGAYGALHVDEVAIDEVAKGGDFQGLCEKVEGNVGVIQSGYGLLKLITFLTAGPKEARAWPIRQGATAAEAAGTIHSDFQRGFICAEVVRYQEFLRCNGEAGARDAGQLRQEGRDYVVQDGDVIHFRFNV